MELSDFKNKSIKNYDLTLINKSKKAMENNNVQNFSSNNNIKQKLIKSLPENFFQKVIEYEMKLKYDFSMETLNELVDLFSVII